MVSEKQLKDIANILRRDSLQMTSAVGSGHPTSCLSCAEIMSVLFFHEMIYDSNDANNLNNDEFVLSKGHAAPIYYAALKRAKCISENLNELRELTSALEGHPIPSKNLPWIKVATGSLGQGLSIGAGMAMAGKMQMRNFMTYVLLGDSECAEGSVWEAVQIASYYKLNNLRAIIDVNKLGQRGETMLAYKTSIYKKRFESFGWKSIEVNGHNIKQLIRAFKKTKKSDKPVAIICKTIKGKGISFLEGKNGWHGRALNEEELKKALKEIPEVEMPKIDTMGSIPKNIIENTEFISLTPTYESNINIATREAYGIALAKAADKASSIISLDSEVSNSTFAEKVKERTPSQFIECFIAEQNMVGMAIGLQVKKFNPFVSTFSAFLTRAHDQIRMAALSKANITICGSHSGVSIGEDGASQMGLEDIAMFRTIPNSYVFYPSDAISTEKIIELCVRISGIKYIRTTRAKTPIIYNQKDEFYENEFKVIKQSNHDSIVLVGAGITLHESIKAQEILKSQGTSCAVIDCYCIKPFPFEKFVDFVKKHGNKVIVTEDHYSEGGIGEMLLNACKNTEIKIYHLSVREIPHSGKSSQLLEKYQIDYKAIIKAAKLLLK